MEDDADKSKVENNTMNKINGDSDSIITNNNESDSLLKSPVSQDKSKQISKNEELLFYISKKFTVILNFLSWGLIIMPLGIGIGIACAIFLYCLDIVTFFRFSHTWILYLLPISGIIQAIIYKSSWGAPIENGFDLVLKEMSNDSEAPRMIFPIRMGPIVFLSTLLTHACGGSAGREGTGLQIGISISSIWIHFLKYITLGKFPSNKFEQDLIIISSLSAAFSGIVGSPFAGAVFGLEILHFNKFTSIKLIPAIFSSISSDFACRLFLDIFGITHSQYEVKDWPEPYNYGILGYIMILGIFSGWCCFLLVFMSKLIRRSFNMLSKYISSKGPAQFIDNKIMIAAITAFFGGTLIIILRHAVQSEYYLGIGTLRPIDDPTYITIRSFFETKNIPKEAFILKLLFTSITVGTGYQGGEVTNLFFIGASLGNITGQLFNHHFSFLAAIGFTSLLAGSTNTPLSCAILSIVMFGSNFAVMFCLSCFISYAVAGWGAVYYRQLVFVEKLYPLFQVLFNIEKGQDKALYVELALEPYEYVINDEENLIQDHDNRNNKENPNDLKQERDLNDKENRMNEYLIGDANKNN